MRLVVKLGPSEVRRVDISVDTEGILASVLDEAPTEAGVGALLQRMLAKRGEPEPFLTDAEIVLLPELQKALPLTDLTALEESTRAWEAAYQRLLPAAQKGLAIASRLVRGMFRAETQEMFEKRVAYWVESVEEEGRVAVLEFIEDLLNPLIEIVETNGAAWDGEVANYLDHHVYHQLYLDIVRPNLELRGRALVVRRLHVLVRALRQFRF